MFLGQSGRKYLVERILEQKQPISPRVLLASNGSEKFVLKEIPPKYYNVRQSMYQRAGDSPYVRGLQDTVPEHSILVHSYLNGNFLEMVQLRLPIEITKKILKDVLRGLAALHERDIAHFDIKATNIMVDWKDHNGKMDIQRVQLIDLESSAHLPPGHAAMGVQLGNYMWRSPEAHVEGPIGKPADIFSFGIVCVYAVLRKCIFAVKEEEIADGTDKFAIALERQYTYFAEPEMLEGFFQYLGPRNPFYPLIGEIIKSFGEKKRMRPFRLWKVDQVVDGFDDDFKDLVIRMTNFDPLKRLTAKEALEHVWFADVE